MGYLPNRTGAGSNIIPGAGGRAGGRAAADADAVSWNVVDSREQENERRSEKLTDAGLSHPAAAAAAGPSSVSYHEEHASEAHHLQLESLNLMCVSVKLLTVVRT